MLLGTIVSVDDGGVVMVLLLMVVVMALARLGPRGQRQG